MNPYYFGNSNTRLYGVYHPPTAGAIREKAVLLCPPFGHEYMRSHWAYRMLADQLSTEGFHVLKFDYFATGDSAGDGYEASVTQWQQDIQTASAELKDMAGIQSISIVALRFGALLAVTTPKLSTRELILWEPTISGHSYMDELKSMHQAFLDNFNHSVNVSVETCGDEFIGQEISPDLQTQISSTDLNTTRLRTRQLVVISTPHQPKRFTALKQLASEQNIPYQHISTDDAGRWDKSDALAAAILPAQTIKSIINVLTGKQT